MSNCPPSPHPNDLVHSVAQPRISALVKQGVELLACLAATKQWKLWSPKMTYNVKSMSCKSLKKNQQLAPISNFHCAVMRSAWGWNIETLGNGGERRTKLVIGYIQIQNMQLCTVSC